MDSGPVSTRDRTGARRKYTRHHLHWCELVQKEMPFHGVVTEDHHGHWWVCYRPSCEEEEFYLCGLIADSIAMCMENRRSYGKRVQDRRRAHL